MLVPAAQNMIDKLSWVDNKSQASGIKAALNEVETEVESSEFSQMFTTIKDLMTQACDSIETIINMDPNPHGEDDTKLLSADDAEHVMSLADSISRNIFEASCTFNKAQDIHNGLADEDKDAGAQEFFNRTQAMVKDLDLLYDNVIRPDQMVLVN